MESVEGKDVSEESDDDGLAQARPAPRNWHESGLWEIRPEDQDPPDELLRPQVRRGPALRD